MPCSPSVPRSSKETLITLTRHLGQQKKQDAAPGETAKAHGAELGEHSEQRGKKPDHGDSHGSNRTTPGAGAGAGSRVGVTLFRTLLLQPLLLLFAHLDLAMLWCVLDGLKRSLEIDREKGRKRERERERERKVRAHCVTAYS